MKLSLLTPHDVTPLSMAQAVTEALILGLAIGSLTALLTGCAGAAEPLTWSVSGDITVSDDAGDAGSDSGDTGTSQITINIQCECDNRPGLCPCFGDGG